MISLYRSLGVSYSGRERYSLEKSDKNRVNRCHLFSELKGFIRGGCLSNHPRYRSLTFSSFSHAYEVLLSLTSWHVQTWTWSKFTDVQEPPQHISLSNNFHLAWTEHTHGYTVSLAFNKQEEHSVFSHLIWKQCKSKLGPRLRQNKYITLKTGPGGCGSQCGALIWMCTLTGSQWTIQHISLGSFHTTSWISY